MEVLFFFLVIKIKIGYEAHTIISFKDGCSEQDINFIDDEVSIKKKVIITKKKPKQNVEANNKKKDYFFLCKKLIVAFFYSY